MFDGFDSGAEARRARHQRRFVAAVCVASVLYGGLFGAFALASAASPAPAPALDEDDVQIEFAELPPSEPPPVSEPSPAPPSPAPPSPSPPRPRRVAAPRPPTEIPDARPAESDAPLRDEAPVTDEAADPGGAAGGVPGGTGSGGGGGGAGDAPRPSPRPSGPVLLPENATPPVPDPANAAPAYPEEARRAGIEDRVIAKIVVEADGRVSRVDVLRGNAMFHAVVRATLLSWRFSPALVDGRPTAVFRIVPLSFRLPNL